MSVDQKREAEGRAAEGRESAPPPAAAPSPTAGNARMLAIRFVNEYGLPNIASVIDEVRRDVETHGETLVNAALREAALGDSRGGITVPFYRAILSRMAQEATA